MFVAFWGQVSDEAFLFSQIHDEAINTDWEENHCNRTNRNEYGVEHNSSDAVPITILRLTVLTRWRVEALSIKAARRLE